ncbi:NAD-dependent malic enzyme [Trichlorobacter ammonificans]|uniref:Malate oxidoreductase, NAD-dependent n=1 Tax=Trichlorobacter ammonificans TaxID=2916410 RepID=A0ABM9D961_9BACT|nr:malic enzyme-like NAD(P)-binding protein [Trichlorobacter ammonificans]CAH2030906.1 Malate oxidoreductase, NAD-dependent [Trichlorobacter ammonificans]
MNIEKGLDKIVKTIRVTITDQPGYLGRLTTAIGSEGGNIGDVRLLRSGLTHNVREITLYVDNDRHLERILHAVSLVEGVTVEEVIDRVQKVHEGGKIAVKSRVELATLGDVRKIYTPGVASICRQIQQHPELARRFTAIGNSVAIVTNGTAILGLGDIGPVAGMPVMEGKSVLFDKLVGISGIPILLDTKEPDQIVETICRIAPTFGAIKLEDIAAPDCFEIERRLVERLTIPVMHDDQHGTAVVVLAALLNATRFTNTRLQNATVGIIGLGAAGTGIAKLLMAYGVKQVLGTDLSQGAMEMHRTNGGEATDLAGVMERSLIVVATTGCPGLIKPEMVRNGQVILALSNPDAEIGPQQALAAGASFAADGKSINNALAFPGIFRGALNARARRINNRMLIAASRAIAQYAEEGELVPGILNMAVHAAVADAVAQAATLSGAADPPA